MQIKEQAKAWVENHEDIEVRRMFGHYYRAFMAGAEQQEESSNHEIDKLKTAVRLAKESLELIASENKTYAMPLTIEICKEALLCK